VWFSLPQRLQETAAEIWLYGSAARGDMWADFWPMRSDIDVLIVTSSELHSESEEAVRHAVYELTPDCGRRIDVPIRTRAQLRGQWAPLWSEVQRDGVCLWPAGSGVSGCRCRSRGSGA